MKSIFYVGKGKLSCFKKQLFLLKRHARANSLAHQGSDEFLVQEARLQDEAQNDSGHFRDAKAKCAAKRRAKFRAAHLRVFEKCE